MTRPISIRDVTRSVNGSARLEVSIRPWLSLAAITRPSMAARPQPAIWANRRLPERARIAAAANRTTARLIVSQRGGVRIVNGCSAIATPMTIAVNVAR